ncbi:MAG: glycosidase [Ignavibacteriae bacterium HGW-Ignavibacteriae-2]|jgi:predicted GH43/DUF377 family glycosyl hydrolase|nr:glycoside hydrolase family 130 protein [Bacteroidota bacterium]PKL88240.1 MAG: glycosidase [Ignavibacteriae bacterium HGW-Ignavibacteriae-2]
MELKRYNGNPIIKSSDVAFRVNSIFNPGAVKYNGKYLLLCRVEMPSGRSSFVVAESVDGISFNLHSKPALTPEDHNQFYKYVEWGIEDVRITPFEDKFFLTYTGYSKYNPLVILAETKDFINYKIHGPISEPSNKDCAIFPEKINGYYYKVDRPTTEDRTDMWVAKSPDLIHWGSYEIMMEPTSGTWETNKIGNSTPPIRTDKGWLMLYHGVRGFGISFIYKVGVVLLDIEQPWKVIGKSREPILSPELDYERIGDVGNVVFTNGWIPEDNGEVKIYYAGADTNICLATTTIDQLISACE